MASRITFSPGAEADEEPLELVEPIDELAELGVADDVVTDDAVADDDDADGDGFDITLDGEETPVEAVTDASNSVIGKLRHRIREQAKELNARRATEPVQQESALPPIPLVRSLSDFDYDEDEFNNAANDRAELVAAHKLADARKQQAVQAAQDAYNEELRGYEAKKRALRVPDFDLAEDEIREKLNTVQQTILVRYAGNAAVAAYALGKRPGKLDELAKITDPVRFAVALNEFEKGIKMTPRKPSTQPERIVRGNAPSAPVGADKMLERLEAEAERTGNRTKVIAHKAEMRRRAER